MTGSPSDPHISVVVPAKNSADTIGACIRSLEEHLPAGRYEIIVVDNDSTDGTGQAASRHSVKVLSATGVFVSQVRNVGAQEASGDLLAFIDSDCTITPEWYRSAVALLNGDPGIGVAGSRHVIPETPSWVEAVWAEAQYSESGGEPRDVAYIPAGNLLTPRKVFQEVGGFDSTLETGEDPDLCNRIHSAGYRIVEWDRIRCIHLGEPKSLWQVFRREKWHGRGVRLRYANGRMAPVVLATGLFGALLLLAAAGVLISLVSTTLLPVAAAVLPVAVPAIYTLSRVGRLKPSRLPALMAVYTFYFLGRVVSLPVAVMRALRSPEGGSDG